MDGLYRADAGKDVDEHLNTPGAVFSPILPVDRSSQSRLLSLYATGEKPNRFYLYEVVGQLAVLAASDEFNAVQTETLSALEFV